MVPLLPSFVSPYPYLTTTTTAPKTTTPYYPKSTNKYFLDIGRKHHPRHDVIAAIRPAHTPLVLTLHSCSSIITASSPDTLFVDDPYIVPLIVIIAAILAFSAQSWINSLLGGDQGLGAFLSDGTGYNRSGFQPRTNKKGKKNSVRYFSDEVDVPPLGGGGPDPLPWLKLPQLDFVDVAGQPPPPPPSSLPTPSSPSFKKSTSGTALTTGSSSEPVTRMENLKEMLTLEVERGNLEEARRIESELERIMKEEGYDFFT